MEISDTRIYDIHHKHVHWFLDNSPFSVWRVTDMPCDIALFAAIIIIRYLRRFVSGVTHKDNSEHEQYCDNREKP